MTSHHITSLQRCQSEFLIPSWKVKSTFPTAKNFHTFAFCSVFYCYFCLVVMFYFQGHAKGALCAHSGIQATLAYNTTLTDPSPGLLISYCN